MLTRVSIQQKKLTNRCQLLLYALIFDLIFEGIIRKLIPPLATPLFFLKDVLCIAGVFLIIQKKGISVMGENLIVLSRQLIVLFIPILFFTAFKDVALAVFGSKQYLLFAVYGILMVSSFPPEEEKSFRTFVFTVAICLIPTTIVAVLQNALPATHWLNLSVGGDSLEAFSAGGYLRVGSTFSFTGQYSWFLHAETFFLATSFFMPPHFKSTFLNKIKPGIYALLVVMLIVSAFLTGGRTAVLGVGGTLAVGMLLILNKRPGFLFSGALPIILFLSLSLFVLRAAKPEFFSAFDARSSGTSEVSHNEEISGRILSGFTDWTEWFWEQDATAIILGNGLGIMSNGSDKISGYAANIRLGGFWTEGDIPTTFWEGGLYLGIIWYGFRLRLIFLCYRLWRYINSKALGSAASILFSYVVIQGVSSQFGIQPPLSIWWWFSIGMIGILYEFEKNNKTKALASAS